MIQEEKQLLLKEMRNIFLKNYTNKRLEEYNQEFIQSVEEYVMREEKGLLEGPLASGTDPVKLVATEVELISPLVSRFKNEKNAKRLILNNEFGLLGNLIFKYIRENDLKITRVIQKYDRALIRDTYKKYGLKIIELGGLDNSMEAMVNIIELNKSAVDKVGIMLWKEKEFYRRLAKICPKYLKYGEYKALDDGTNFRNNRQLMLEFVKINPMSIAFIPSKYKGDYEIVHEAIKQNGHALMYASSDLQDNKQLVYEAVSNCGLSLSHASKRLKNDLDICLKAVENSEYAFHYVGENVLREVQRNVEHNRYQKACQENYIK